MSGGLAVVPHVIVAINLDQADLAELSFADDPVAGLDQVRRAAALGADLHDPLVLAGRGQHGLALGHVDADRLLDVDVGARLDGRDHRQGVPVVGRGDQDDVQVLFLEHLAVVGVGARSLLRGLPVGDDLGGLGQHLLVDVAQRNDLDRRDLDQPEQVGLAVPAAADQAHAFGFPAGRSPDALPARSERAKPAAAEPAWRNSRRFMDVFPKMDVVDRESGASVDES